MTSQLFKKVIDILNLWVIEESIDRDQCTNRIVELGFDMDTADLLMDIVNCKSVVKAGVKNMIVEYLDQSFVLDDDLDDYRLEIAEKLGVSYDREKAEKSPYEQYLRTESGVYA